ncbi:VWA domain-containing protein [Kiritimatiellota bacterium B12222]|nr:VWA domain-containing protein [Kiritimatiellota bacterium B12222]
MSFLQKYLFNNRQHCATIWSLLLLYSCTIAFGQDLLFTSDTKGKIFACSFCPQEAPTGGFLHSSTLIKAFQSEHPDAVWYDLGNAFTGGDLPPDQLHIVTEIYKNLNVNAINLSNGDFRFGVNVIHELLANSGLPVISANIVWEDSSTTLFPATLSVSEGKESRTIIGLTEPPAGRQFLPQVKKQFDGVDVLDPVTVLRSQLEQLPANRKIGILYHGSPQGLRNIIRAAESLPQKDLWIAAPQSAVNGIQPPPESIVLIAVSDTGDHLTQVAGTPPQQLNPLPIHSQIPADQDLEKRLKAAEIVFPHTAPLPEVSPETHQPLSSKSWTPGTQNKLSQHISNRGIKLSVHSLALQEKWEDQVASPGKIFALLEVSFENRQSIDLILEKDYPEPLMFGEMRSQLFLKLNQKLIIPLRDLPEESPGVLPAKFVLSESGSEVTGLYVFEIPEIEITSAALLYAPAKFPMLTLHLLGKETPLVKQKPIAASSSPDYLHLEVLSLELKQSLQGESAPPGTQWAIVDLIGHSLQSKKIDALAVNADANLTDLQSVPVPVLYQKAPQMLQLVIDGEHAFVRNPILSTLAPEPVFPSASPTGGRAVFLVPQDAKTFDLYLGFPQFKTEKGFFQPAPITLNLTPNQKPPSPSPVLAKIEDNPLPLQLRKVQTNEASTQVAIWTTLTNISDQGGMYQASSRATLHLTNGDSVKPTRVELKAGIEMPETVWIPANKQARSFAYIFDITPETEEVIFNYGGVSKAGQITLNLSELSRPEPPLTLAVEESDTAGETFSVNPEIPSAPLTPIHQSHFPILTWESPQKENKEDIVIIPPADGNVVARSASLPELQLTAHRFYLLESYYTHTAEEGEVILAIDLELTRPPQQTESFTLPDLAKVLPIRLNGSLLLNMKEYGNTDPQLANSITFTPDTPSVRNFVFYKVPLESLGTVDLLFTQEKGAPAVIPLIQNVEMPLQEPVQRIQNQIAELGLYGFEYQETFLGKLSYNGGWLVVDIRGISKLHHPTENPNVDIAEIHPVKWRDWKPRMQVIIDGKRSLNVDRFMFDEESRLLPGVVSGGQMAFKLSPDEFVAAESIQVQCGFAPTAIPGASVTTPDTIYFTLKGDPNYTPPVRDRWQSLADLDFTLDMIEVSRPEIVNKKSAPIQSEWIKLEIGITSTAKQGLFFKPGDLLELTDLNRVHIKAHPYTWQGPEAPPNNGYETWIPQGGYREFSMYWQVKKEQNPVRLKVNGIRHYRSINLFPEEHPEEEALTNPDINLTLAENGLMVLPPQAIPKGIEGVGLKPEQVNHAIDSGRDYLWSRLKIEIEKHGRITQRSENYPAILALVHCKAHLTYPEFDQALRQFISALNVRETGTYKNAIMAMVIEAYGDPVFLPKMEELAHFFVETQGENGTWNYNASSPQHFYAVPDVSSEPAPPPPVLQVIGGEVPSEITLPENPIERTQSWEMGKSGDHSVTQFAVLGLWSAERSGIPISDEVWQRVLSRMSLRQHTDLSQTYLGGFSYTGKSKAYGSMTAAGICILAISMDRLMNDLTPREHLRIRNGLSWLVQNFMVEENPLSQNHNYYYIYSLERVGQILGIDFIGEFEWYPLGADYLVKQQSPTGAWPTSKGEDDPMLTTSFALLFLTRATPSLDLDPHNKPQGPGMLETQVMIPDIQHQVYLILDSSGSMRPQLNGVSKLDIAKTAITDLAASLPPGTRIAVRAYGHTKRAVDIGAEQDTELIIPWMETNPDQLSAQLASLRALGKTPLALSLTQALNDIPSNNKGQTMVVLLTDGGEDNRKTDPVAAAAAYAKRKDIEFFILGFDINRPEWTQQLTEMAKAAQGIYWPVQHAERLTQDLQSIVVPPVPEFNIIDANGESVAQALFGSAPISLPPGAYRLEALDPAVNFETSFHIRAEGITKITLDMGQLPRRPLSAPSTTSKAIFPLTEGEEQLRSPATKASFCTSCGNKLTPGARFCTSCGTPIK